ncbi:MAG TPA: hypothetical protein VME66_04535 [Candidatus Acidoferrales bacterium]|nr:hypothetical protein [Candidatus Acidoferrales bacterium]
MKALLRVIGRCIALAVVFACAMLVAVQYWRLFEQNLSLSAQFASAEQDVTALRTLREQQLREIRRLSDPQGAIPEIHDRLRMVGKNEALIYVIPPPTETP